MSTDEGTSSQDKGPLTLRERQSEIKKRLESPIASKKELYTLLASPLLLLQIQVPDQWAKYAIWENHQKEADRKAAQVGTVWISDIQKLLLEKVLIDWKDEIEESLPSILQVWFAPVSDNTSAATLHDFNTVNTGSFYVATLSTISAILSSASLKYNHASSSSSHRSPLEAALPAAAVRLVYKVLDLFSTNFSLCSIEENLQTYQTSTKRSIIWSDVVRELTSLPERVANATMGRVPQGLERCHFVKTLGRKVEEFTFSKSSPDLAAILLAKLVRNGYFGETSSEIDEPVTIWPAFLRNSVKRGNVESYSGWLACVCFTPLSIQVSIALSLASFVDRFSLRKSQSSLLLNGNELEKAGLEGKRFLDVSTWERALEVAIMMESLLVVKDRRRNEETDDSDLEEDEKDKPAHLLCQIVLPSSTGYWSPLMARILVHLLSMNSSKEELSHTLTKIIELWSAPLRIKTAMWEQEVYLTTLILLFVAQLPPSSIVNLCTSSTFINGVSTHLEHLSPRVRRMGMLVAEIVSMASKTKALSFGQSLWEGKGEGKEESRVLRALYHGWKNRRMDIEQSTLFALGLSASVEVAIKEHAPRDFQPKKSPKTRSLPVKKSAPIRKKPLIESLDDDDNDDTSQRGEQTNLLPSLLNIRLTRGRPVEAYVSDVETSSSEEGSSDSLDEVDEAAPRQQEEKKEEFGLGIPHKKKQRPPIYIHELAPLFREQERESNKLALKHAEILIKKKTGWGGEVDENAVNLALAILSFQNNFNFKKFDERKKSTLTALVFASPHLVAPCLAEQYFGQQYSIAQRVCILNALAFGARQLSIDGQSNQTNLQTLSEELSHKAILRSRIEGERRIPELQQKDKTLLLKPKIEPRSLDGGKELPIIKRNNAYLSLAGPAFIFPLINRFWAHLNYANSTKGRRFVGSGSTILFDSFLVGAFLDTLAILCSCGQNSVNFSSEIVPEVMNLALTITNTALARAAQGDVAEQGGGPTSILGASSNLFLLLLDASWELDSGRFLLQSHVELIIQIETWAGALFEGIEGQGRADRVARCTAALLLRINEMKQGVKR